MKKVTVSFNGMSFEEFSRQSATLFIEEVEGDVVFYSCGTIVSNGKVLNPDGQQINFGCIKGSAILKTFHIRYRRFGKLPCRPLSLPHSFSFSRVELSPQRSKLGEDYKVAGFQYSRVYPPPRTPPARYSERGCSTNQILININILT